MASPFNCCKLCKCLMIFLVSVLMASVKSELNLDHKTIEKWAQDFGKALAHVADRATGLGDLRAEYLIADCTVREIKGGQMVIEMKENMEQMLRKKVEAIRKLVTVAEEAHNNYSFEDPPPYEPYPKAKKLKELNETFPLEENEHFNYIPVNINKSTVHVPTNVYDESTEVLNGVAWSEKLDKYFKENAEEDPTLTWQYFGSASGFFRNYPGIAWDYEGVDLFDCRTRGWYIQAATSPKDVVILIDSSGSMTGLRMEIAKATVVKILDTLSDDDFFNVLQFADVTEYVDDCFNETLVQANADNKKRMKEALNSLDTGNIAHFDSALIEAFELLKQVNESGRGAKCNRAIMLITDGAPETYENIFEKYNWPDKNVRVFTFLIGREVGESKQVKWMACANKGYYSHISTLADVHEHVQDYIHVLSRPMVIKRANHTIWTSVYVDAAHDAEGLNLMTSVAQPVFDTRNDTVNNGNLLGVMGTDVPLKELTKMTPPYKLGVNGYAFATTNNGYILFHPDFRPMQGKKLKPNYNSVDLAEVEISDTDRVETDLPTPNYDMELRTRMVDRNTGHERMKVKVHYDDMKRVVTRHNRYYFTEIENTPFSLGIALPEGYGLHYLDGRVKLEDADLNAFHTTHGVKLANWNYCKMKTNETKADRVTMLLKYLKDRATVWESCDKELIEGLLFDVSVTRGMMSYWMKAVPMEGMLNDDITRRNCTQSKNCTLDYLLRNGIELVWVGTKSGLTRYFNLNHDTRNLTDPSFVTGFNNTIEELYYKKAVDNGFDTYTVSIPFDSESYSNTMVTITAPVVVEQSKDRNAVAAVVGLQMKLMKFGEIFANTTGDCPDCNNITCSGDELNCYILDNNGYIIVSKKEDDLGKFLGMIDPALMKELIIDDNNAQTSSRGVFERKIMYDFQGLCDIWAKGSSGASSIFLDPLRKIVLSGWWLINELALFMMQFNLINWWGGEAWAEDSTLRMDVMDDNTPPGYDSDGYKVRVEEEEDQQEEDREGGFASVDDHLMDIYMRFLAFGTEQQARKWRSEMMESIDYFNPNEVEEFYLEKERKYSKRVIGERHCVYEMPFFSVPRPSDLLPQWGKIQDKHNCLPKRSYSIHRITKTNLMLLVVDATCGEEDATKISTEPIEIDYNDTLMCQRLQTEIYRRRPSECYAYHPKEDSSKCGGASALQLNLILTISLLALLHTILETH